MAATFTALNAAPAFLTGRKVVSKARAGPATRAPFQLSAAADRPLWAPGASSLQSKELCLVGITWLTLRNTSVYSRFLYFSGNYNLDAYCTS